MKIIVNHLYGSEEIDVEGKICIHCDEFKTLDKYDPRARNKAGERVDLRNDCRSCMDAKGKIVAQLKKIHKIPDDHSCPICKRKAEDFLHRYRGSPFCLDHDHKTGKFRGYICMDCNTGLARFHENSEAMEEAIEYLENGGVKTDDQGLYQGI